MYIYNIFISVANTIADIFLSYGTCKKQFGIFYRNAIVASFFRYWQMGQQIFFVACFRSSWGLWWLPGQNPGKVKRVH